MMDITQSTFRWRTEIIGANTTASILVMSLLVYLGVFSIVLAGVCAIAGLVGTTRGCRLTVDAAGLKVGHRAHCEWGDVNFRVKRSYEVLALGHGAWAPKVVLQHYSKTWTDDRLGGALRQHAPSWRPDLRQAFGAPDDAIEAAPPGYVHFTAPTALSTPDDRS